MRAYFLALVIALALVTVAARSAHASRVERKRPPPVELIALNTHESFSLQPDAKGRFGGRELRGWNRFLRCHHTGRVHSMATHLADLIYAAARHFETKVYVVAGYRAPKIAKKKGNPKSPHKKGVACDFRLDGVANSELRDWLRESFDKIGVGYYPNSEFVHLDVGRKVSAFWIDYSGPGERARYSKNPSQDLEAMKEGEGDSSSGGDAPQGESETGVTAPIAPSLEPTTPQ
jgi:uncharacterized protein YcbK (DUF882 family)